MSEHAKSFTATAAAGDADEVVMQIPGAEPPDGVMAHLINIDPARGLIASIIHLKPGTTIPAHQHEAFAEAHYVLEGDLVNDGVQVITPNPKTSGGARWNYLAAWAWAEKNGQDPREFVGKLYRNVPVLDSGARGATTTFAQRGIGDVLLAWENEAYLALKELGEDQFDIVAPSVSIRAEPPVALVEGNLRTPESRELAQAYLDYLYAPEGQALAFKHFYRAWDASAANPEDVARFPELDLVGIEDFGGWARVQPEHFGDGGIFDQIFVPK